MSEQCPPCRVCGERDEILSWPPEHPERTICPTHCETAEHFDGETGHQYEYERGDRTYYCVYCGVPASDQWLAERADIVMTTPLSDRIKLTLELAKGATDGEL